MLSFKEIHAIERLRLDGWVVTLDDVITASRHRNEGDAQPWMEALEDAVKRRGQRIASDGRYVYGATTARPSSLHEALADAKTAAKHAGERTGI